MSLLLKAGLVGVTVGGVVTFSQVGEVRAHLPFDGGALSGLTALVGAGTSAAGTAGPIDKTFTVRRVHIDGMVAKVELVTVQQAGPVRVQANGKPETMKELEVRAVGDELFLRLDADAGKDEAWFPWNLFNMWSEDRRVQDLSIRITATAGTPYEIEGMIGTVNAGNIDAPLRLHGHAMEARFGNTLSAQVAIRGSGHVALGAVKETLDLEVRGSGDFEAASAAAAQIEISGGGDVKLGPVSGSLGVAIKGAGDIRVARVDGPVDLKIRGAGDVAIDGGRADPFAVDIAGAGDVTFKGHAVNPTVRISGAGDVKVDTYSGQLRQEISGAGNFEGTSQQPAAANATGD